MVFVAAYILLPNGGMFFIPGAIMLSALLGLVIIGRELRNAPEGLEDETGFHLIRRRQLPRKRSYEPRRISAGLREAKIS
jgi:hypothetical protein